MKEKRISIPIMRLIGFVTGFVCITVAGHSFIRSTIKFIRRTIGELGEALKKGMPINDYDEDETQETEEAATKEAATEETVTEETATEEAATKEAATEETVTEETATEEAATEDTATETAPTETE